MMLETDFIDNFGGHLAAKGKQSATVESYSRDARRFLNYLLKLKLAPTKVEPEILINYRDHLIHDCHEKENTVRRAVIGVRQFYRFLCEEGVLLTTPFDEVPIPVRNDALPSNYAVNELDKFIIESQKDIDSFVKARNAVIISLLAFEGLKATEVIALSWHNYLPSGEHSSLSIMGTRSRTIYLDEQTRFHLDHYKSLFGEIEDHPNLQSSADKKILISFKGRDGSVPIPRMTRHGVKFILYDLAQKVGINSVNAELLRHYAVNFLLEKGRSSEEIMHHLGLRRLGNIAKHMGRMTASL